MNMLGYGTNHKELIRKLGGFNKSKIKEQKHTLLSWKGTGRQENQRMINGTKTVIKT